MRCKNPDHQICILAYILILQKLELHIDFEKKWGRAE